MTRAIPGPLERKNARNPRINKENTFLLQTNNKYSILSDLKEEEEQGAPPKLQKKPTPHQNPEKETHQSGVWREGFQPTPNFAKTQKTFLNNNFEFGGPENWEKMFL